MGSSAKVKDPASHKRKQTEEGEDPVKETKKSKFNISLKVQDSSELSDQPILNSGPGPKIIIAKSKKKDKSEGEEAKPRKRLNKRRKKKIAAGLPVEETIHESKGQSKALQYLQTWAADRENWKFEKCRQIWLLHNAYEKTKVSDEIFPTLLDYIQSIKGGMRQVALDIASKKLKSSEDLDKDDKEDEASQAAVPEDVKM